MKTDAELEAHIDELCKTYKGQIDDLYQAVGLIVVGRRFGWRVMRLVAVRSQWTLANKLFGNVKDWMREEEHCAHRSLGLSMIKSVKDYWLVVRGLIKMPHEARRGMIDDS